MEKMIAFKFSVHRLLEVYDATELSLLLKKVSFV